MFKKARLILTAQYLAIIMLVSFSFSAFIYKSVSSDFQRRLNVIENRLRDDVPRGWRMQGPVHDYFIQDLLDARTGLILMLVYANGVIFVMSSAAGYYLAGKTLTPIENVMSKQKRFIADASHELKTPLTALQTSIEVALRDKKLTLKDAKKVLKENLDDTEKLNKLANDLIRLAWYQAGDNFILNRVSLKKVVGSVRKQIDPLAKKRGVKMRYEVDRVTIKANKESIERLITILMDNAVKYTRKGGSISLSIRKSRKNLVIQVADRGVGIAKKDLKYIFERFYRVDSSRSKLEADGYGLGLSMAKQIVELHKGTIKVKSVVGKGSTFVVKIPVN